MGWVQSGLINRFRSKNSYVHIERLVEKECNVPSKYINNVEKVDGEDEMPEYIIEIDSSFISERYIEEFLYYNDSYKLKSGTENIDIQKVGNSGSYTVESISSFPYILRLEYFKDDELRSESKSRIAFLRRYSKYRRRGAFKFTDI